VARTFRSTVTLAGDGQARVPLSTEVVDDLGPRPGESLKASMRGTEFTGKVAGSLRSPGLLIPEDVVRALGLREGQGVRLTVIGRSN
jgi:hypothetical protein